MLIVVVIPARLILVILRVVQGRVVNVLQEEESHQLVGGVLTMTGALAVQPAEAGHKHALKPVVP